MVVELKVLCPQSIVISCCVFMTHSFLSFLRGDCHGSTGDGCGYKWFCLSTRGKGCWNRSV